MYVLIQYRYDIIERKNGFNPTHQITITSFKNGNNKTIPNVNNYK